MHENKEDIMKNFLTYIIPICIVAIGISVYAITLGAEPPAQYMKNLKTCTPTNIKVTDTLVSEYVIKGKLLDGRCQVTISSYTNFANPKVYEGFKNITKAFGGNKIKDSDIPTQAQMIEQGKKEKMVDNCKFTPTQRNELYNAYLKHDGKYTPAKVSDKSIDISWSSDNTSSYERLMMSYSNGTCTTIEY